MIIHLLSFADSNDIIVTYITKNIPLLPRYDNIVSFVVKSMQIK